MLDLSSVTGGNGTSGGDSKPTEKERQQLGQGDFLKLMTTQLKNQDPMSPMENADFMAQIAQFTSASGIQDMQQSFSSFTQSMQTNQALEAASLVGRDVVIESDSGWLPGEGALSGSVALPSGAGNLTVTISDGSGQAVRRMDLGQQPAGEVPFSWDGLDAEGNRLEPGAYRIAAQTQVDGEAVSREVRVNANVNSVTLSGAGEPPRLNLEGLGERELSAVRQVK